MMPLTTTLTNQKNTALPFFPDERRKNLRFGLETTAALWMPTQGKEWLPCRTISVGIKGASLDTAVALPLGSCIDLIVFFPAELTHGAAPVRVRFCSHVLRVDPLGNEDEGFRIAVRTTRYKFLRDLPQQLPSFKHESFAEEVPSDPLPAH